MKIFVGFGYNNNDKWIKDLVIPFIEELGCSVVTGEDMQGDVISDGVIAKINESDAFIGFLTKRDGPDNNGFYTTHHWVIAELTTALNLKIPFFEIREIGVDPQKGMIGNYQRYEFDDKAAVLLQIAKYLRKEKSKQTYKTFMLLPDQFADDIRPHLKNIDTKCMYRFLHKGKFYDPEEAKLERLVGQKGFGIIIKKMPDEEAQVEIKVQGPGGMSWNSGFVSIGLINVNLQKEL